MADIMIEKLREMVARCEWKFAKTMPFAPHEYIVRDKCPLTDEEFVCFIDMQRRFGVKECWASTTIPTSILMTTSIGRWGHRMKRQQ